ncbi:MAG: hypothetical protein ACOH16_06970 [Propionibacteriaceae bacterium]
MRRRTLLLGLVGMGASGCSVTDPRVQGTPQPIWSPTPPPPLSGAAGLAGLEGAAAALLTAMSGAAWAGADAARYTLLAGIHRTHQQVLASVDPLLRETAAAEAATVAVPAGRDEALAGARTVLSRLKESHEALASQTTGVVAAFWASQAAAAVQTQTALTTSVSVVTKAVPLRQVVTMAPDAAARALLDRYHEAVYGLESALGRLSAAHPSRVVLGNVVLTTKAQRDALVARSRAAAHTPDPGAAAYSVPATATDDQALALAAQLLAAIPRAAVVVVASGESGTKTPVADLEAAATLGFPLGMGLAEYPGWPD